MINTLNNKNIKNNYEIIISGIGIVGLSFALNLNKHPYFTNKNKILLIDKMNIEKNVNLYSDKLLLNTKEHIPQQRVFTISNKSLDYLDSLNINKDNSKIKEINKMIILDNDEDSYIEFDQNDINNNLGIVIENDHLLYSLYNKAKENNIDILLNSEIESIDKDYIKNELNIKINNNKINTKLLIGAEGFNSKVAKLSNINYNGFSHKQKAIVCTLELDIPLNFGFQKFLKSGPFAILPLWDKYASLVWSLDNYNFDDNIFKNDDNIIEYLNKHLLKYNIKINFIKNKKLSFPLKNINAEEYCKDKIALIGDAAHSIHPMAGQGLNLGLSDSYILSNYINKSIDNGLDVRNEQIYINYEFDSKFNNSLMQNGLQFIKNSYSSNNKLYKNLRNISINSLNNSIIKNIFKDIANGSFFYK